MALPIIQHNPMMGGGGPAPSPTPMGSGPVSPGTMGAIGQQIQQAQHNPMMGGGAVQASPPPGAVAMPRSAIPAAGAGWGPAGTHSAAAETAATAAKMKAKAGRFHNMDYLREN